MSQPVPPRAPVENPDKEPPVRDPPTRKGPVEDPRPDRPPAGDPRPRPVPGEPPPKIDDPRPSEPPARMWGRSSCCGSQRRGSQREALA